MSSPSFYQIRECENATCGLRYPLTEAHPFGERCPLCLGATQLVLQRNLTADKKFITDQSTTPQNRKIEAMLDNVRSAWNVGAIFRTADAFGVSKLHLCGITPTPENPSVSKTALGADKSVGWTHNKNALTQAQILKADGRQLWALEQDKKAFSIYNFGFSIDQFSDSQFPISQSPNFPITLIVGNEVTGVDPGLLELCDQILYIPMRGEKRSLNVEVAFGVAVSLLV